MTVEGAPAGSSVEEAAASSVKGAAASAVQEAAATAVELVVHVARAGFDKLVLAFAAAQLALG